jgi:hypothetical protein
MLDAHVYMDAYPAEVAGLLLVDGVDADYFIGPKAQGKRSFRDSLVTGRTLWPMCSTGSVSTGWARRRRIISASTQPPKELTVAEGNTITQEARSAGSLRGRPLIVLSSENADWRPEHRSPWIALRNALAQLLRQAKLVTNARNGDLIYEAPEAVVEAVRATRVRSKSRRESPR